MFVGRYDFTLQCAADGTATVYSDGIPSGYIRQMTYVPDAGTPLNTNAILTITGETTGLPIITITHIGTVAATFSPQQATHTIAGAAALYAAGGAAVLDLIAVGNERIKIVISGGGNLGTGKLYIWIG